MKGLVAGALLAAGALALAFRLAPWQPVAAPAALPPELAEAPDLYMRQATITRWQPDGSIRYRLSAQEIRHFEGRQEAWLLKPDLDLRNGPGPPWRLRSERGELRREAGDPERELVLLRDDVVLRQSNPEGGPTIIRAQALNLYPQRRYAETDEDVMIETDLGRTVAGGLRADLEGGFLELLSDADAPVHTIVLPEQIQG